MEELENGTQCRLSEKKIRDRIGLEKDKQPEDLRTLKLPGNLPNEIRNAHRFSEALVKREGIWCKFSSSQYFFHFEKMRY